MLAGPDVELVSRDHALPGLQVLLDTEALLEALKLSYPGLTFKSATRFYTRYKPGISCLAAYQVEMAERTMLISARCYGAASRIKLDKVQPCSPVSGLEPSGSTVLADLGIVISFFPYDRKLRFLTRLEDDSDRRRLLRRICREHPELWSGDVFPLRYKPERRYVGALKIDDAPHAVLKFYTPTEYERAFHNAQAFTGSQQLRLPSLLGYSHRYRVLAFEWLSGCVLSEVMRREYLGPETVREVGRAFARLHDQSVVDLVSTSFESDLMRLCSLAAGLSMLCPRLADRAHQLATRLIDDLLDTSPTDEPIHGDCYAKQVILTGDQVAIVDFDEARRGDRRTDLGLFIAHLERDRLRGTLPPQRVELIRGQLLEGYGEVTREPEPADLDLYTAIGLFGLAHAPFRHCEPDWPIRIEAILDRVDALLPRSMHRRQPADNSPDMAVSFRRSLVAIHDPFGVTHDTQLVTLSQALDPQVMQLYLDQIGWQGKQSSRPRLTAIRVVRYKPSRRCLLAYDLEIQDESALTENQAVLGKIRSRGLDKTMPELHRALQKAGFDASSVDGVSAPEPVGSIPTLNMWLQRCVPGIPVIDRLVSEDGTTIAERVAAAIHKLHLTALPTYRQHTMDDELRILHDRLSTMTQRFPKWTRRLTRILEACDKLGASVPTVPLRGIHRDFYHDQILIDEDRLYLLDFDLFCQGPPGLDVGNFIAHLTEYSIRTWGRPDGLAEQEDALATHFLNLSGLELEPSVRAYTTLTLVRHIHLSSILPGRQACTEPLLELCEERLGIALVPSRIRRHG